MTRLNTVTITGTLADEPQIRYSKDGVAHTTISLGILPDDRAARRGDRHPRSLRCPLLGRSGRARGGGLRRWLANPHHRTSRAALRVSEDGAAFSTVEIVADEVSLTVAQVLGEVHPPTSGE